MQNEPVEVFPPLEKPLSTRTSESEGEVHPVMTAISSWMLDVGCWMLDVGCWMLGVGCWMLDVGCWMLEVGGWRLEVGGWRLEVGGWSDGGSGDNCNQPFQL